MPEKQKLSDSSSTLTLEVKSLVVDKIRKLCEISAELAQDEFVGTSGLFGDEYHDCDNLEEPSETTPELARSVSSLNLRSRLELNSVYECVSDWYRKGDDEELTLAMTLAILFDVYDSCPKEGDVTLVRFRLSDIWKGASEALHLAKIDGKSGKSVPDASPVQWAPLKSYEDEKFEEFRLPEFIFLPTSGEVEWEVLLVEPVHIDRYSDASTRFVYKDGSFIKVEIDDYFVLASQLILEKEVDIAEKREWRELLDTDAHYANKSSSRPTARIFKSLPVLQRTKLKDLVFGKICPIRHTQISYAYLRFNQSRLAAVELDRVLRFTVERKTYTQLSRFRLSGDIQIPAPIRCIIAIILGVVIPPIFIILVAGLYFATAIVSQDAIALLGFILAYGTVLWQGVLHAWLGVEYDLIFQLKIRCKKMTKVARAYGITDIKLLMILTTGYNYNACVLGGEYSCWANKEGGRPVLEIDRALGCNELLRIGRMTLGTWQTGPEVIVELTSSGSEVEGKGLIRSHADVMHAGGTKKFISSEERNKDSPTTKFHDRVRFSNSLKVGAMLSITASGRIKEAFSAVGKVVALLGPHSAYKYKLPQEICENVASQVISNLNLDHYYAEVLCSLSLCSTRSLLAYTVPQDSGKKSLVIAKEIVDQLCWMLKDRVVSCSKAWSILVDIRLPDRTLKRLETKMNGLQRKAVFQKVESTFRGMWSGKRDEDTEVLRRLAMNLFLQHPSLSRTTSTSVTVGSTLGTFPRESHTHITDCFCVLMVAIVANVDKESILQSVSKYIRGEITIERT
ncbi:hypothetical protein HK096_002853 [Nowakowskiella sp. JEL0078]|nr:hypothetical protein HK096_002853 [Nowakowskiella sp. JEL0078]